METMSRSFWPSAPGVSARSHRKWGRCFADCWPCRESARGIRSAALRLHVPISNGRLAARPSRRTVPLEALLQLEELPESRIVSELGQLFRLLSLLARSDYASSSVQLLWRGL